MNVLVVDDQRVVLEGLKRKVDWYKIGISRVFWAESAFEAKKTARQVAIDILLTDIEMPVESGIELVAWFQEEYPETQCIFLTAHADFSYAQKAISYGGFDYILQPAKKEDIENVVRRCIKELNKKSKLQKMADKGLSYDEEHMKVLKIMINNMFEKVYVDKRMQSDLLQEITKNSHYDNFLPLLIETNKDAYELVTQYLERIETPNTYICTKGSKEKGDRVYEIVICGQRESMEKKALYDFLEELYILLCRKNYRSSIYIGNCSSEILASIMTVRKERENNVYLREGIFYVKKKKTTGNLREPKKEEWKQWLLAGDGILIKNQISNLLEFAEVERYLTISYMKSLFGAFTDVWVICSDLKKVNKKRWFDDNYTYDEFQYAYRTIEEFNTAVEFVIIKFNEMLKKESDHNPSIGMEERIKSVGVYIEENLEKNITRRDAAAMCFISEDYFSKLFKAEIGHGFKEYTLMKKMDYCKRLLKETTYPIGVIAGKVGYDNFSNFSQLFKKHTGMTPQDFRSGNG